MGLNNPMSPRDKCGDWSLVEEQAYTLLLVPQIILEPCQTAGMLLLLMLIGACQIDCERDNYLEIEAQLPIEACIVRMGLRDDRDRPFLSR